MKTKFDFWEEAWNDLEDEQKASIYNEYLSEHYSDDQFFTFDDEFFQTFFEHDVIGAVRAVHFGNIQSWSDDYIRFNGYGNLESLNLWDVVKEADDNVKEIYNDDSCWNDTIDPSDIDDEFRNYYLEKVKTAVHEEMPNLDDESIENQFDDLWDDSDDDSDLDAIVMGVIEYFSDEQE